MITDAQADRIARIPGLPVGRVARLVATRRAQIFQVPPDGIIIAGMAHDGRVHIYAAIGDLPRLLWALGLLENWYLARGGCRVTMDGRLGWVRVLAGRGYRRVGDLLQKDLGNG